MDNILHVVFNETGFSSTHKARQAGEHLHEPLHFCSFPVPHPTFIMVCSC